MAAADGDAVAAYNVTLNTLAGQGGPAQIFKGIEYLQSHHSVATLTRGSVCRLSRGERANATTIRGTKGAAQEKEGRLDS